MIVIRQEIIIMILSINPYFVKIVVIVVLIAFVRCINITKEIQNDLVKPSADQKRVISS